VIGLLHGYLLDGSGSNLWTRCIVEALCMQGIDVQLFCQEPHPEKFDCIADVFVHNVDGTVTHTLSRATPYPGRCTMHQPMLDGPLPVFVWDKYEQYERVIPMIELDDAALEGYVARNADVVERVVREYGVTALHANHAALIARVAERVAEAAGIPYAIMPHGSELVYALKQDVRFRRMAASAMSGAGKLFVHGNEMRKRVQASVEAEVKLDDSRFRTLPLGVHTSQFEPVPRDRRREKIGRLLVSLHDKERVHGPSEYDRKAPDADLEEKISQIDWEHDAVLLFVGRLISAKGVQTGLAALPLLLARDPGIRLIIVGHGPLRVHMEGLVAALASGDRDAVMRIVNEGRVLEGTSSGDDGRTSLDRLRLFYDDLTSRGELDEYFRLAREHVRRDRVVFTGYLTHEELQHLFPCCDAGLFPSLVMEAGPLVFLEALASGCFPLGTFFGGMRASIEALRGEMPDYVLDTMKLDPRDPVPDIVEHTATALQIGTRYKDVLVSVARARYDWQAVSRTLADTLDELATS
jgi:glycosyltransferase involved in cell wall biosynthesis